MWNARMAAEATRTQARRSTNGLSPLWWQLPEQHLWYQPLSIAPPGYRWVSHTQDAQNRASRPALPPVFPHFNVITAVSLFLWGWRVSYHLISYLEKILINVSSKGARHSHTCSLVPGAWAHGLGTAIQTMQKRIVLPESDTRLEIIHSSRGEQVQQVSKDRDTLAVIGPSCSCGTTWVPAYLGFCLCSEFGSPNFTLIQWALINVYPIHSISS